MLVNAIYYQGNVFLQFIYDIYKKKMIIILKIIRFN